MALNDPGAFSVLPRGRQTLASPGSIDRVTLFTFYASFCQQTTLRSGKIQHQHSENGY
jgi:hypothetical protein